MNSYIQIQNIEDLIGQLPPGDASLPYLTQFYCISLAAAFDKEIVNMFTDFVRSKSTESEVVEYFTNRNKRLNNLRPYELIKFVRMFNESWSQSLNIELNKRHNGKKVSKYLDELYDRRHSIAHGASPAVNISELEEWKRLSQEIIRHVHGFLN